jgi:hypothetical protein
MDRKLVGVVLLVLASGGCRMCTNCYDDLPPVLDGPYPPTGARVGTVNSAIVPVISEVDEIIDPTEIQPLPEIEPPAEIQSPSEIAPSEIEPTPEEAS